MSDIDWDRDYDDWELAAARLAADNTPPAWYREQPATPRLPDHKCDVCGVLLLAPGWCPSCESEPAA